ncbi:MAG: hypothetical protein HY342_02110 [Candidatus Lambdaproteobacteria bacterium]|nr:hypothetical protein [Candidatus Lambdaproteobacteria bacterium]
MAKGDRQYPAAAERAPEALAAALDGPRRRGLEDYARAQGMSTAEALALAVDRLLASADTDDYLTEDDVPDDLY